jgi:hypothetical protein
MMDKIDSISESRFAALRAIEGDKLKMARAYNKRVRLKSFQIRELVWKMILSLGTWDNRFCQMTCRGLLGT